MTSSIFIIFAVIYCGTASSAFFLNWGSQETSPYPQYYYHQRLLQAPTYPTESTPVPSIPIQVPIQAQLSAAPSVQNVQLVPCLCPVSQEYEFEKNNNNNNREPPASALFYSTSGVVQQPPQQHKKINN